MSPRTAPCPSTVRPGVSDLATKPPAPVAMVVSRVTAGSSGSLAQGQVDGAGRHHLGRLADDAGGERRRRRRARRSGPVRAAPAGSVRRLAGTGGRPGDADGARVANGAPAPGRHRGRGHRPGSRRGAEQEGRRRCGGPARIPASRRGGSRHRPRSRRPRPPGRRGPTGHGGRSCGPGPSSGRLRRLPPRSGRPRPRAPGTRRPPRRAASAGVLRRSWSFGYLRVGGARPVVDRAERRVQGQQPPRLVEP